MQDILEIIDLMKVCFNSEAEWKIKFKVIFSLYAKRLKPLLDEHDLEVEWLDPDMDYIDDVSAFMRGVEALEKEILKLQPRKDEPCQEK